MSDASRILPSLACALLLGILSSAHAQQIYKTVDENGNVVYTDRKPSEDAEPIPLPELTVVDPVEIGNPAVTRSGDGDVEFQPFEFSIVSPMSDEVIVNTGYRLDVEVELDADLPRNAEIVYKVDGEEKLVSREQSVTLEGIIRGPHQVSAEVRTRDGQVLGTAPPVSFFMRQNSALYNRPG